MNQLFLDNQQELARAGTVLPLTRALSLTQPWATLVVAFGKNVENRTWHLPKGLVGVPFWVHAAKGMKADDYDTAFDTAYVIDPKLARSIPPMKALVRGAIIGQATASRCLCPIGTFKDIEYPWHFTDQHGFVLRDVKECTPIPMKGSLGFWRVPEGLGAT